MNTRELADALFTQVFARYGLPLSIVGDRDTRLTAKQVRGVTTALGVKLALSTA
jgi:transposase InsO family protein